MNNCRWK